jgi:hypothetical protein
MRGNYSDEQNQLEVLDDGSAFGFFRLRIMAIFAMGKNVA